MDPKDFYLLSNSSNERIRIPDGETVIGRGPFLKVKDTKVSRSHAVISLENNSLKIKPIHTNPTFFYPATGKCVILDQNQWKELKNNDKISLLPNDLIFSVETDQEEDGIQETVSSKAQVAELKSDSSIIQEEVQINEKSNLEENEKSAAHQVIEVDNVDKDHQETFEDSIDSICEEDNGIFRTKDLVGVADKESEGKEELPVATSESSSFETKLGPDFAKSSAKDSSRKSPIQKKRVLPSWMLETASVKGPPKKQGTKAKNKQPDCSNEKRTSTGKGAVKRKALEEDDIGAAKERKIPSAKRTRRKGNGDDDDNGVSGSKQTIDIDSAALKADKNEHREDSAERDSDVNRKDDVEKVISQRRINEWTKGERLKGEGSEGEESNEDISKQHMVGYEEVKLKQDGSDTKASKVESLNEKSENVGSKSVGSNSRSSEEDSSIKQEKEVATGVSDINDVNKKPPRCKYGKSCYRRNPAHFTEYSHSDNENEDASHSMDDDRPECPYGTDCYRKNPQHKLEYKHTKPPSAKSSESTRKSTRIRSKPRKSVVAGDDDDDGEENDYDYDDSFIDDDNDFEEDSSSFEDDDDDEEDDENWAPEDLE